ncbi:unnamed protein product [Rotaria sordida]|uniref:Uncharacterized protein n=1 Tax=Rotaria sordida TaxID=392033 RepID=A0A814LIV6_9BILA|nr:unnamed protein product [Rotaria sordida]CAF1244337.1 unnamed protein product [Rotaria sordida]
MSTSISNSTNYSNSLPDDIFNYNQNEFNEFIKETRGADLAELFSFQAIRHATHLIDTTCDEILSILQEDSKDINNLKKLCCFQLSDNKFRIKLGVKLAINNLIQSLKIKQEQQQQKKKKRSAQQRLLSSVNVKSLVNDTLSQDEIVSLESTPVSSVVVDTSSTHPKVKGIQRVLDEIGHLTDIKQRLNQWWISINSNDNVFLEEGVHYFLQINKSINDKYACILSCLCHAHFKLSFMPTGFFKLSSFCRHIKEKKCFKQVLKRKNGKENSLVDNRNSTTTQSNTSNSLSNTRSKKSKTSQRTSSKRFRSPSTETSSDTEITANKKNRSLSSNSTNSSQEKRALDNNEN